MGRINSRLKSVEKYTEKTPAQADLMAQRLQNLTIGLERMGYKLSPEQIKQMFEDRVLRIRAMQRQNMQRRR